MNKSQWNVLFATLALLLSGCGGGGSLTDESQGVEVEVTGCKISSSTDGVRRRAFVEVTNTNPGGIETAIDVTYNDGIEGRSSRAFDVDGANGEVMGTDSWFVVAEERADSDGEGDTCLDLIDSVTIAYVE